METIEVCYHNVCCIFLDEMFALLGSQYIYEKSEERGAYMTSLCVCVYGYNFIETHCV